MTRPELKESIRHDAFTDSVERAVVYANTNRKRLVQIAVAVAVVALIVGAIVAVRAHERSQREADLAAALEVVSAPVGQPSQFGKTFATEGERRTASLKALSAVIAKINGTREGLIAQYYRGTLQAQQGNVSGAQSDLKVVADSTTESAPLAKVALAQLYAGQGKTGDAERLLKDIVNNPTKLVSKAQAQVFLAQLDQTVNPAEAKRIIQSLKSAHSADPAVARAVDQLTNPATASSSPAR